MSVPNQQMSPKAWSLLFTLSLLWGGSFIFTKYALRDLDPFTVVASRVAIAAIALQIILRATRQAIPRDLATWRQWFVMGVLNNMIPFSLIVWSQTRIEPGLAAILNATTPLFGVILAHILVSDDRLTANRVIGVLMGIGGVLVLVGPDVIGSADNSIAGQIAVLIASLSYAVASLWARRLRGNHAFVNAAGMVTCSSIVMIVVAAVVDQPWERTHISGLTVISLLGLGILSTTVGYFIYFTVLRMAGATNLLLVTLIIPVSALWLSWMLFSETIDRDDFIGMVLIGAGLLAIDGRAPRWVTARIMQNRVRSASVQASD